MPAGVFSCCRPAANSTTSKYLSSKQASWGGDASHLFEGRQHVLSPFYRFPTKRKMRRCAQMLCQAGAAAVARSAPAPMAPVARAAFAAAAPQVRVPPGPHCRNQQIHGSAVRRSGVKKKKKKTSHSEWRALCGGARACWLCMYSNACGEASSVGDV